MKTNKLTADIREIAYFLKRHLREDFQIYSYALIGIFLGICISVNYLLDFEDSILDRYKSSSQGIFFYFLFYAFPYYTAVFILQYFNKSETYLHKTEYWTKSLVCLLLLAMSSAIYPHESLLASLSSYDERYFITKIFSNIKKPLLFIPPFLLLSFYYDRTTQGIFGLKRNGFKYKPYLILLILVLPFILLVSTQSEFLATYPQFKAWKITQVFGLKHWQMTFLYELVYSLDFILVEWFFRGALVIGLSRLMGHQAVLPMVCAYTFLHFGKPLEEALSSIIGGYFLGVIALYSRTILGGCLLHIGVALTMDLSALFQHSMQGATH
ncbi:CPBP family intramembrane glutamic endopeptidase [Rapidithrix thailandica]|uniref:CPBP family intramembrane glutamic endopeptidase n=1 Tax=Rapidithrix thailandica TaxID=413964 RepID=A0AAW9S6I8_9BACT